MLDDRTIERAMIVAFCVGVCLILLAMVGGAHLLGLT